jgi:hypothetical protein
MVLASALTKQLDAAWAVGTNAGGLDTGAIGNNDYYIWLIMRSDTGVVDALFSTSSSSPSMPANYDYKRLIGWFKREAGAITAFKTYESYGGSLDFLWASPTLDVNLAATLTTSRRTDAVRVPLTFTTIANLNVAIDDASAALVYVYCPDLTDVAPSATAAPLRSIQNASTVSTAGYNLQIRTSSTGTIASRATVTVDNYYVSTLGFQWARRN